MRLRLAVEDYESLVGRCVREVADFGEVMSRVDPSLAVQPGLWSASRYVWHTVDVLRFGTERLWTTQRRSLLRRAGMGRERDGGGSLVRRPFPGRRPRRPHRSRACLAAGCASKHLRTPRRRIRRSASSVPSTSCSETPTKCAITSGTCNVGHRQTPSRTWGSMTKRPAPVMIGEVHDASRPIHDPPLDSTATKGRESVTVIAPLTESLAGLGSSSESVAFDVRRWRSPRARPGHARVGSTKLSERAHDRRHLRTRAGSAP